MNTDAKHKTAIHQKSWFSIVIVVVVMLVMMIVFSSLSPYFFSGKNLATIGLTMSVLGIITIGQSFCLLLGGFDLSGGYMCALGGVVCALLTKGGVPYLLAVPVALAVGGLGGFINGLLITKARLPAFIATLGTMSVYHGLVYVLSNGAAVMVNRADFQFIGSTQIAGIPLPIIILVAFYLLFYAILRHTLFGRRVYLVGGNAEASRISGINTHGVMISSYVISSVLAAIGGIVLAARAGAAQITVGSTYALDSVTAAVLGGISLSGGKGNLLGALLGVLITSMLQNGLIMVSVSPDYQYIATGIVLIFAVMVQTLTQKKD